MALLSLLALSAPGWTQSGSGSLADFRVYTKHPRLWLDAGRLDRLHREVERQSDRWRQLQTLSQQGAKFPEEPLWQALQFQVIDSQEAGRNAVEWALAKAATREGFRSAEDLRLAAVVFDWCFSLLTDDERSRLAAPIGKAAQAIASQSGLEAGPVRSAVLAAVAVADEWEPSSQTLLDLIGKRWRGEIQPALQRGETPDRSEELMATMELFHVVRYNLQQDLWRESNVVFRSLPRVQMLRYYPQPVETASGYLRQPAEPSSIHLDPREEGPPARIAEMMMVAYENTLEEYQFLQGWIRHDAFVLRDPYGALYEFLWLNPYLPGLSYSNSPPVAHDEVRGRVFARKSWEENDVWVGYLGGEFQIDAEGQHMIIDSKTDQAPLTFPGAAVVLARVPMRFEVEVPRPVGIHDEKLIYIVGLREGQSYDIKVNKARARAYTALKGGIVIVRNDVKEGDGAIDFEKKVSVEIRAPKR